jgi:hypothetical protein
VVCGVTGFVLAPAAGAVTALTAPTQSTAETGGAVLAAALCGAGLALLPKRPHPRALTAAGLAVALTASLRAAGPAGALAGLVLLLAERSHWRWPALEGAGQVPDPGRAGTGTRNSARGEPGKGRGRRAGPRDGCHARSWVS